MRAVLFLAALIGLGCQSGNPYMDFLDHPPRVAPPDGRASVVFMRPGSVRGTAWSATVFDVTDGEHLIGIFSNAMKQVAMMEPGEHYFMTVLSGGRGIMRAELEAGRIYYVKLFMSEVHPLLPGTQAALIQDYWESTRFVERNARAARWAESNLDSTARHRDEAMLEWQALDEAEQRKLELLPQDGVETPIAR